MLLLLLACSTPDDTAPVYDPNPIVVLGGERPAKVTLPSDYTVDQEWPLVVMLHGYGATGTVQDVIFGLGERVDALGFVLLVPEGLLDSTQRQYWNATPECCDLDGSGVDDVAYLTALIDEARATYPVSTVRLVGHSNGGYMSYRMACAVPERLDRIAVLAGAVYKDEADCHGTEPVSVLHIHGRLDGQVPYDSSPTHAGALESLSRWKEKAGCDTEWVPTEGRDYLDQVDGEDTRAEQWGGCAGGRDMQLWTADEGDHLWFPNRDTFKDDVAAWLLEN
jgi:polyhydroxybutyrate depolymerase